jgi:mRNA deadenylase 3'-5' endonuclease subunit Ccr4
MTSESRVCCLALLQELRTVILINCGACHFARDLQPASAQGVRFVVIDSHRPVCPKYNDADDIECVLLLDEDDPLSLQQIPAASDLDRLSEERELAHVSCCTSHVRCGSQCAGVGQSSTPAVLGPWPAVAVASC